MYLYFGLSSSYRSKQQRKRENFQGAKIQNPMENRKSLCPKEQKRVFNEQNCRYQTYCNRDIKGYSGQSALGQKRQNRHWSDKHHRSTKMLHFRLPNFHTKLIAIAHGTHNMERYSLAQDKCHQRSRYDQHHLPGAHHRQRQKERSQARHYRESQSQECENNHPYNAQKYLDILHLRREDACIRATALIAKRGK